MHHYLAKNGDWLVFFGGLKKACLSPLFAATNNVDITH